MNKFASIALLAILALPLSAPAQSEEEGINANEAANLVILDEIRVKNLGIVLVDSEEADFEETIFAIGRIDDIPSKHAAVSSRISGRALSVSAIPGDQVTEGQVLVRVESRQPGNPPPVIELASPITGMVLERHVRIGEPVEPEKKLFDIVDLTEVWAIARVPEQEAGRIKIGSKARIRVAAVPGEEFNGELIRWGTTADIASGTLDAIFRLENKDLHLRTGMRAEFSIITETRSEVTAVPREAVQGDPANRVVYIEHVDLPHTFIKSPVVTGARNDKFIEIVSGIFPGDRVVTKGSYFLGSAGGGGISLKEALDAAHGHEHNEDGSLMTDEQKAARDAAKGLAPGSATTETGPRAIFFSITTIILFFLLVLSSIKHFRDARYMAGLTGPAGDSPDRDPGPPPVPSEDPGDPAEPQPPSNDA